MHSPDWREYLRDVAVDDLPRWAPTLAAATTVAVAAAVYYLPWAVGRPATVPVAVLNAVLAVSGAAIGGLLSRDTLPRRIAAAGFSAVFGLLCYAGLICAACMAQAAPAFFVIAAGVAILSLMVRRAIA